MLISRSSEVIVWQQSSGHCEYGPADAGSTDAYQSSNSFDSTMNEGVREYEITNHLGNVMATVSDVKMPYLRLEIAL